MPKFPVLKQDAFIHGTREVIEPGKVGARGGMDFRCERKRDRCTNNFILYQEGKDGACTHKAVLKDACQSKGEANADCGRFEWL